MTALLVPVIPAVLLAPGLYDGYVPRAKVAESVALATSLKQPITRFYGEHSRLPAPHEAEKFRIDGGKYAQSIVYDAAKQTIVVTMGDQFKNQRFAIHVEEKDGNLVWTCRTMDLRREYLPAPCRD